MEPYIYNLFDGFLITLGISFGSLLLAVTLGLMGAMAKLSKTTPIHLLGETYSTLIRGVPDLVWMLLIYFGGQILINNLTSKLGFSGQLEIDPFLAGIITIGIVYGAYMTETFRGAILAIPSGQTEAAVAYGMGRMRVLTRIVIPQMIRFALPGFTNNWLVLVKSTALVSILGISDLTNIAKLSGAALRGEVPAAALIFMTFAAILYLLITTISLIVLRWVDKRYSRGIKRITV